MSSQSRPLSYSYGSFAEDMRTMNQSCFEMPDPNDFIRSTVSMSSGRQSFHPSQLRFQSPPYPIHDHDEVMSSEHVAYSSRSISLRQPAAEDFLPKRCSLPLRHSIPFQSVGGYHSDQNQPVIVSGSQEDPHQQHDDHTANPQLSNPDKQAPKRRSKDSAHRSHRRSGFGATNKCSQSEPRPNSNASSGSFKTSSSRRHGRVQSIGSDMYQPTLGGLHRISDLKCKDSKCDRVKRAMSRLNPLRGQRRSWA